MAIWLELNLDCFYCGIWNKIKLKISRNEKYIKLSELLYINNTKKYYKGLGQYFIGFVKSIALSFKPTKSIIVYTVPKAERFYLKEGFREYDQYDQGKFVWKIN